MLTVVFSAIGNYQPLPMGTAIVEQVLVATAAPRTFTRLPSRHTRSRECNPPPPLWNQMEDHTTIRQHPHVEMMKKSAAFPQVEVREVIQEVPQGLVVEWLGEVPQVALVEIIRQVPNVEYWETVKSLPNFVCRDHGSFVEELQTPSQETIV